jgi:hypothetical protein
MANKSRLSGGTVIHAEFLDAQGFYICAARQRFREIVVKLDGDGVHRRLSLGLVRSVLLVGGIWGGTRNAGGAGVSRAAAQRVEPAIPGAGPIVSTAGILRTRASTAWYMPRNPSNL